MIAEWLALALLVTPCSSKVESSGNVTMVERCPMPEMQGPPRPPIGWRPGMLHDTNKEILTRKAVKTPKYTYTKKKRKPKKRKNRR